MENFFGGEGGVVEPFLENSSTGNDWLDRILVDIEDATSQRGGGVESAHLIAIGEEDSKWGSFWSKKTAIDASESALCFGDLSGTLIGGAKIGLIDDL